MDRTTIADELGALRVLVDVIKSDHGQMLRFRCITCERNPDRPPDSAISPSHDFGELWHPCYIWHVPDGSYPYAEYSTDGGFLVLPFDLHTWRGHLLHDVRAEWNRAFISSRGVSVQEWPRHEKRSIVLHGWGG